ncbi:MAG: SMC family ATPase [Acholeplasmataceae bacterium]|nr:SMC family ATPase [Acholeplasmataceae bacterium]
MKPLKLIMNAFGAYAEEQIVDFSLLGDKTFFLIHGPTGAGKTTILDAISFALYGTASGDLRESKNLRSDYAPPSAKTQVDFTFRSGSKNYEVVRSPEQEVAKLRGEGTRKIPAAAALYEISGDERNIIASGINDVTKQVETILGFKAEQFCQIVLLPQGEFRRFLIAESKDRKSILETLFKTGIYRQIEQLLSDKSKQIEREYDDLKKERSYLLETAACENKEALLAKKDCYLSEQKTLQIDLASAQKAFEQAKAAHQAAQTLAAAFAEVETAAKAHAILAGQADEIKNKRTILENAERASLVEPYYFAFQKTYQKQTEASEQNTKKQALLREAEQKACLLQERLDVSLPANVPNIADALQELLTTTITDIQKAKNANAVYDKLARTEDAVKKSEKKILVCAQELKQTQASETAAKEELKRLRDLQIKSLASHLAVDLHEGIPCPVCGSTTHPLPAASTALTEINMEDGEKNLYAAQQAVISASGAYKAIEAQLKEQQEQLLALQVEYSSYPFSTKEELVRFLQTLENKQHTLQTLQKEHNELQLLLTRTAADAASAGKYLAEAETAFQESREEYKNRLGDNGFTDQSAFLAARRPAAEQTSLKQEVSSYEQRLVAAKDRLTRAQSAIDGKELPNLTEFAAAENKAAEVQQELSNRFAVLAKDILQITELLTKLEKLEERSKTLEEIYKNTSSLAQCAQGNNSKRLTFSGFVLQSILDDVLQAANMRLTHMSRGRYTLSRLDEVTDARRESGLSIEVMDSFTGISRPVKTLSGGEIFLASLSLALGLSDVVQAYAGGIRLDTILVDEGFGSLDPESLDMAIRTLTDLQKGGRLVGIISHVAELKERISTRLEITPGPRGSSASFRI